MIDLHFERAGDRFNHLWIGKLWFAAIAILSLVSIAGCQEETNRKPTYPVTGTVHVDGKPVEGIRVEMYDQKGLDPKQPTYSSAFTDADGKFVLSTYESGDGVPEGSYAITFMWGRLNVMSMAYSGPDRLKNKYLDHRKTPFKLTVEKGKKNDMGIVELTAK